MPCYQSANLPGGVTTTGRTSYRTEAECNQACQEGACCDGAVCTVKPQCQCQGAGKTFKGVGTVCDGNPCLERCNPNCVAPPEVTVQITVRDPVAVRGIPIVNRPDGSSVDDPFDPLVPSWARSAYSSFQAIASGTYVLKSAYVYGVPVGWTFTGNSSCVVESVVREGGTGPAFATRTALGSTYLFKSASLQVQLCWSCSTLANNDLPQLLYPGRLLPEFNGSFTIRALLPEYESAGDSGSFTTGPLITQVCDGASTSVIAATPHTRLGFVPINPSFIKRFADRFETAGSSSGVFFPMDIRFV